MEREKPLLIPAAVPWSISTSAPHLKLHETQKGEPSFLTFIAYFKLNEVMPNPEGPPVVIVKDPGEFSASAVADEASYRMVRVIFDEGMISRKCFAASDREVIPEEKYDWSKIPGSLRMGEDALSNITRTNNYWSETGYSPDPGFYEVMGSTWSKEMGISDSNFRHYIAVGQDEYFDIIARGWRWEAGQRA